MRAAQVRRILRRGKPFNGSLVVLLLAPGTGEAAVVAGRRVGGAVQRNRARRILRAAWHEVAPQVGNGYDAVLVAREAIDGARTQDLVADMTELLRSKELA